MGHYYIHFTKGKLPKKLEGVYTSIKEAQRAVDVYLMSKDYSVKRDAIDRAIEESNAKRAD